MRTRWNLFLRWAWDFRLQLIYLITFFSYRLPRQDPGLVVCMTSYPARIRGAWVSIESLFRQDYRPFLLILVLAESQFPKGKLPLIIRLQIWKGLRIMWVAEDNGSFDHLWPAYSAHPDSNIISVDDDKIFPSNLVRQLTSASRANPGNVIGARGWEMKSVDGELRFGEGWQRADRQSPSDLLFMPPGNGSLYPPGSLPQLTGDDQIRKVLCPRADDVWYWAMTALGGVGSYCLGLPPHRNSRPQLRTPALAHDDPGPEEFEAVRSHFSIPFHEK